MNNLRLLYYGRATVFFCSQNRLKGSRRSLVAGMRTVDDRVDRKNISLFFKGFRRFWETFVLHSIDKISIDKISIV